MRVLVVHADTGARHRLWRDLAMGGHEVVDVADLEQANVRLVREDDAGVVVIGISACGSGIDELRRLRAAQQYRFLLAVVAEDGSDALANAYRAGADVVLTAAAKPGDLLAAMCAAERAAQREGLLREETARDPLTAVLNRRALLAAIHSEIARVRRFRVPLSIALADLDHFKRVNDVFGHGAGDRVLVSVVERMRGVVRPYDVIGRWGGEEFVIALPSCPLPTACRIAERMRSSIGAPLDLGATGPNAITVSVGVVTLEPYEYTNAEELISAADAALYQAKSDGRDRVKTGSLSAASA